MARIRGKKPPPEDALRARAEQRVVRRTGLLWLLYCAGSYVAVNALLIAIWVISDSDYPWFLWVLAVWGLGLAFHIAGYVIGFRHGRSREGMIEEYMEGLRKRYGEPEAAAPETSRPGEGTGPAPSP